ncbi:MAG: hypothetical protein IIW47_04705, partial [Bacteroidales bacterium]|nr:hypothetical protein [Bacteroidales bacterium]
MQGRYYALEADGGGEKLLALEAAVSYPRIDRIVLTLDYAQRTVQLGVLRGGEAATERLSTALYNLSGIKGGIEEEGGEEGYFLLAARAAD